MKTEVVQQLHKMNEKKVILMRKPHSPHEIVFSPDPSDNHFFNVVLRKVKTGAVVCSHLILTSDVQQWQSMYEKDGYKNNSNE